MQSKYGVVLTVVSLVLLASIVGCSAKPASKTTSSASPPTTTTTTPPTTTTTTPPTTTTTTPPTTTTTAPPTKVDGVIVTCTSAGFSPGRVTINVGTKVVWENKDTVEHNVTSVKPDLFLGNIPPGGSFSFVFSAEGPFEYYDAKIPANKGIIDVTDPE
jgi:plastocyanin